MYEQGQISTADTADDRAKCFQFYFTAAVKQAVGYLFD